MILLFCAIWLIRLYSLSFLLVKNEPIIDRTAKNSPSVFADNYAGTCFVVFRFDFVAIGGGKCDSSVFVFYFCYHVVFLV